MSSTDHLPDELELDAEMSDLLATAQRAEAEGVEGEDLDSLFHGLETFEQAHDPKVWWWRSRSTVVRRLIALSTFAVLAMLAAFAFPRPDLDIYPSGRLALELFAMASLMGASLWLALRPLHRPALPRYASFGLAALVLLATFIIAALPAAHTATPEAIPAEGVSLVQHSAPCLFMGLLLGLPVFAAARLLDRGAVLAPLLAASAAGLTGELVMQLHCPVTATDHMLAGHFTIGALYIAGIMALQWLRPARR